MDHPYPRFPRGNYSSAVDFSAHVYSRCFSLRARTSATCPLRLFSLAITPRCRVSGKTRCFFSFSCWGASATAQRSLLVISVLITSDANDACIARQKLRQPSIRVASRRLSSFLSFLVCPSFPAPLKPLFVQETRNFAHR